jgi:hypothetical protein
MRHSDIGSHANQPDQYRANNHSYDATKIQDTRTSHEDHYTPSAEDVRSYIRDLYQYDVQSTYKTVDEIIKKAEKHLKQSIDYSEMYQDLLYESQIQSEMQALKNQQNSTSNAPSSRTQRLNESVLRRTGKTRSEVDRESLLRRTGKKKHEFDNESSIRRTGKTVYEFDNESSIRRTGKTKNQRSRELVLERTGKSKSEHQKDKARWARNYFQQKDIRISGTDGIGNTETNAIKTAMTSEKLSPYAQQRTMEQWKQKLQAAHEDGYLTTDIED